MNIRPGQLYAGLQPDFHPADGTKSG